MTDNLFFLTMGNESYPSSRYRGYNFSKILNNLRVQTEIWPQGSLRDPLRLIKVILKLFRNKNLVYFQKINNVYSLPLFLLSKKFSNKVIFDFDDSIFLEQPLRFRFIAKHSEIIVAGNSYLADYARQYNSNVYVIPTSIDLEAIKNIKPESKNKKDKKIIIGWIGTYDNLKYLQEVKNPLENLANKYDIELQIIGPQNSLEGLPQFKNLKIKVTPWKLETEWKELSKIDIGIMPLPDDKWTRGKCGLKALQYMALEIPAIASNVGTNKEIIQNGKNGFLASNEKDWTNYLEKLIQNPKLREELGKAGRKTVEKDYSLEKNAKKLAEIIKS